MLKIYRSTKVDRKPALSAGEFETDKKSFLHFACSDGYIAVQELQLEGKRKMTIEEFLRGYRFE
jgi:methionyl-tRNA formyltransferase